MKKLGKRIVTVQESVEAYCQTYYCSCALCTDTNSGMGIAYNNQYTASTYGHY